MTTVHIRNLISFLVSITYTRCFISDAESFFYFISRWNVPFDFHSSVNDNCRGRHNVVAHHFGYIFDLGKIDIKIVLTDYTLNYLVCLFAFGTAAPVSPHFPR